MNLFNKDSYKILDYYRNIPIHNKIYKICAIQGIVDYYVNNVKMDIIKWGYIYAGNVIKVIRLF